MMAAKISVVTPTLKRPDEVRDLLANLSCQTVLPFELLLVDGAPEGVNDTEQVVFQTTGLPFQVRYIRRSGGTAIQRNAGIDAGQGDFISFVDDDIRLEPDFFERMMEAFVGDQEGRIGGITGYITNQHLDAATSRRWQWYRRMNLFTTYEPGRFDYETGYPINRYLQPPHDTLKPIDFMGAGCAVWRADVFKDGLRFSEFFTGFGVQEDAHLALRARRKWELYEYGRAKCRHLYASSGREDNRSIARKTAINNRYLFITIVPKRALIQEFRFWRVQFVQLVIFFAAAVRSPNRQNWSAVWGKLEGIFKSVFLKADLKRTASS